MSEKQIVYLNRFSDADEKAYLDETVHIVSYPRSGSHWTRRMLGEITAMRSGVTADFGRNLAAVAGFKKPEINSDLYSTLVPPYFKATHAIEGPYAASHIHIYLRRNFDDVYRSIMKARAQNAKFNWGHGTYEEEFEKWKNHVSIGCSKADVVLDYEVTRTSPEIVIRLVDRMFNMNITEEEIRRAVAAGSRENMLAEQARIKKRKWDIINTERT